MGGENLSRDFTRHTIIWIQVDFTICCENDQSTIGFYLCSIDNLFQYSHIWSCAIFYLTPFSEQGIRLIKQQNRTLLLGCLQRPVLNSFQSHQCICSTT